MGRPAKQVGEVESVETISTDAITKPIETRRKAVQIDRNEMIAVRSVTYGNLVYVSPRTGMVTRWSDFGVVEWMEFGELLTMKSSMPKFFTKPWVVIDDEEVLKYLGLEEQYKLLINIDDINAFFNKPLVEISALLKAFPSGIKETIKLKARDMVRSEELNDLRVIKVLENEFKIGLLDMMK